MNKVFLIGNLTKDPDLAETASGATVCRFTIAVNRSYTNGEGERETDFFNCTAWRSLAESVARYCKKGNKLAVSGSVQIRSYEGNDGLRRTAVDIIAQDVEFLTAKSERTGEEKGIAEQVLSQKRKPAERRLQAFDDDGDIPF